MENKKYLEKILSGIEKIFSYTDGKSYDSFERDSMVVEACVFNLGQIGEYANKISEDFKGSNTDIPWKNLYGLRNRIVHDYEGVNLVLIWDIISEDLIELKKQIENLL